MPNRVINFNPGPSTLPLPALERAQQELLDYQGTGMSIMEHSHRGKEYDAAHGTTISLVKELLAIPDTHQVLLMQGGAAAQFALLPMNLLLQGGSADYVLTGSWAKKAFAEAKMVGNVRLAADASVDGKFTRIPTQQDLDLDANAAYVHITSNNTIAGTQYFDFPDTGSVPLVADMSSDIMWRPFDVSRFGLIYAGAQKNLGPAGITLVIVRKDVLEKARTDIPKIFQYAEIAKANSLQNTPPTFIIYMVGAVIKTIAERGGLPAVEKENRQKAQLLYDLIDANPDYYRCPVQKDSRSVMNAVFRLPTEELEAKFIAEAKSAGLVGLKGHRSVGGCRASMYNAMPLAGVQKLVAFMQAFQQANPT